MNSKLRNSLSAFAVSGATLAIALMVAVPASRLLGPSAAGTQRTSSELGSLTDAVTLPADALGAGAAAASALAFDAGRDMDAPNSSRALHKGAHHRRQTVVMPYFSFSPRG